MVDRRALVLGGGAAALVAVAGGISPAAAAATRRSALTAEHARRVLGSLDVKRGLVDLEGALKRLTQNFADYEASAPRDPKADDLYAWTQQRVTDLTGKTDPFETVVNELPQTRALLAFGFAVFTQHQDLKPPPLAQSMPVPTLLTRLEPDFFGQLAEQMEIKARNEPDFGGLVETSSTELDRIIKTLAAESPEGSAAGTSAAAKAKKSPLRIAIEVALLTFFIFAQGSYSC